MKETDWLGAQSLTAQHELGREGGALKGVLGGREEPRRARESCAKTACARGVVKVGLLKTLGARV